jgi:phosphate transport system substrate-binding protein
MRRSTGYILPSLAGLTFLAGCSGELSRNDYSDNTPTSGMLKVYYDEGLHLHVKNQAFTFESQYDAVNIFLRPVSEDEAVQALFNDSCESIVISRVLNDREKQAFASKQFNPRVTPVAISGIAIIASEGMPLRHLTREELITVAVNGTYQDSSGVTKQARLLFDRSNSSVLHYFIDSVMKGRTTADFISAAGGTEDCISYVADHPSAIGIIDFAWLSDSDDELYKQWSSKIRFLGVRTESGIVYPSQSSFKTGAYPFKRAVNVIRKTGEFTLAKGFETFVAGPKGQLTFLKQGLLPARQAERSIQVKFEPVGEIE